jgi:hypothetical protein
MVPVPYIILQGWVKVDLAFIIIIFNKKEICQNHLTHAPFQDIVPLH